MCWPSLIGLINVKDFFAFKKGVTLSIPESAKPGIYARVRRIVTTDYISVAIGLSVVLAVLVNVVELTVHCRTARRLYADSDLAATSRLEKLCLSWPLQRGLHVR